MSAPFHRPNLGVRPQQISFAGQVESIDGDLCRPIDVAVGPADFHCVGLFQVGHTDGDSEVVARQIALVVSHIKYAILAAGGYGDASPDAATIALHPFGPNLHPVVPVAAVIVHLHHPHEKTKSNSASTLAQAPYGGRRESGGCCRRTVIAPAMLISLLENSRRSMALFYFIRHGETEWNAAGRLCGRTDVPLSDAGRRQAQLLALRLKPIPFAALYSSPLRRALETASILGHAIEREPVADFRLVELSYGAWEGRTYEESKRANPDVYRAWERDPGSVAPPEGESGEQTEIG